MSKRPLATVGGLVIAPDGEILLVRSKKWRDHYSLPGGKVEKGESREEAFKREVLEETSLKITNLRFALVQDCIFSTEFWRKKHFIMHDFIADLDPLCSKEHIQLNSEAYAYLWISPQKALQLPLHHECRVLIEWYLAHPQPIKKEYGTIGICQHRVNCVIGIHPHERVQEQEIWIDVKTKFNLTRCFERGNIEDTINYVSLAQLCSELAQRNQYLLLENLAKDIVNHCISRFHAAWVWVRIRKPSAISTAAYAYVEFESEQEKGIRGCGHL